MTLAIAPIVNNPSKRKANPDWVLCAEVSAEVWVVMIEKELRIEPPLPRRTVYYDVYILNGVENKVLNWYGDAKSFQRAQDIYQEAIQIALELYV